MRTGFDYLADLADEFFAQRFTQQSLRLIHQHKISGWEVWLQVEFGHFFSLHDSKPEWWREEPLEFDRRSEKERQFFRPDFLIRKKGWKRESYIALELKQHPVAATCISNMAKDIGKIDKMKRSSIDLRAHWVLGVFEREKKADIKEKIVGALDSLGYAYNPNRVVNKFIRNSPYGYCIF